MAQSFLEEFCGNANGSWFLTKYLVDTENHMLTVCGEAGLVCVLHLILLVNVIINGWMIFAYFPRYSDTDKLDNYYVWKVIILTMCLVPFMISLLISPIFPKLHLPVVILIEEGLILLVWSVMIGVWVCSIKQQSITRKCSLTVCQFLATKGVYLMCGQRARQYGLYSPQTILVCISAMFLVTYAVITYYEKREINRINGHIIVEELVDVDYTLQYDADEGANIFSKLFFIWTNKLITRGADGKLNTVEDVFHLPPSMNVQNVEDHFVANSPTLYSDNERFSVYRSLLKSFGCQFVLLGFLRFAADVCTFFGPIMLRYMVEALELPVASNEGYFLSLAVVLVTFVSAMLNNHFNFYVAKIGMKIRTALITAIYDKLLRIPVCELSSSSGQIMNYVSTDVDRIVNFANSFHQFWSLPVQLIAVLFLLYRQVGKAFLAGVVTAIILVPVNQVITVYIGKMSAEFMYWKDQRMKWIQEMVKNIRTIKSSNLEEYFVTKIGEARSKELHYLKIRKYLDAICVYLWASAPLLIQISIFTVFVKVYDMKMTAPVVYPVIALISMLIMPLNAFPWVLNGMIESYVSLKRLERFFSLQNQDYHEIYCQNDDKECLLSVHNAKFYWDFEDISTLSDISLTGPYGSIIGITGDVGCGKSTLLLGLLGETKFPVGQQIGITQESTMGITYVGQERWLSRGTIEDNILMGAPYDHAHYHTVLRESCLKNDLQNFPGGDQYVISENGATLSGGQRTRVVIARALYQDTAIYLFDEPFASLDNNVSRQVYHLGIRTLKARRKLIFIASHDIMKLVEADHIIKLNKRGRIEAEGHPSAVYPNEFNKMMMTSPDEEEVTEEEFTEKIFEPEEDKQVGAVQRSVYLNYFSAMGKCLGLLIIISVAIMQTSKNGADYWLSRWTEDQSQNLTCDHDPMGFLRGEYEPEMYDDNEQKDRSMYFLTVYICIAAANTLFTLLRAFLFAYGGVEAATNLHESLLNRLLKATVTWWDRTPSGRVVNRLCSDIYTVDDNLPFVLNIFLASMFNLIGAIVISVLGIPFIIPILIILSFAYHYIQRHYRKTTVELKRLCSVSLSPLYSHLSDSVSGLVTIRAHKYVEQYCQKLRTLLTLNLRAQYSSNAASQWLNIRLSLIAVVVVAGITLLAILDHRITKSVDTGLVGLALTYALSLTSLLNSILGSFIETEKEMVSVERIEEYTNGKTFPTEPENGQKTFPGEVQGNIEFEDVKMRYTEEAPLALDRVKLSIPAGARCAIIGRTGSGKSSLFQVLLRTVPVLEGRVLIDGIDIRTLSLPTLRRIIGYIPQHPFILNGSFYENLTLFTPNMDINNVLTIVRVAGLENLMERLGGLDGMIEENGSNISYGEKQIISICRILLYKPKIVLVDEGTSYVDATTHKKMTELLDTHLHHTTILSIIHNKLGIEGFSMLVEMCAGRPMVADLLRGQVSQ